MAKFLKLLKALKYIFRFFLNILGMVQRPHSTYLFLEKRGDFGQVVLIWILVFFSLLWTEGVKHGVFSHPLFFAVNFFIFFIVAVFSFLLVSLLLYFLGNSFGGKGKFEKIVLLWSYSYFPTICWFLLVSFLFFLLPPPRSFTLKGYAFSGALITISIALFYWKLLLYYLTLRIGFKITWGPIIKISMIFFPTIVLYSYLLYKLGIFKVPFL